MCLAFGLGLCVGAAAQPVTPDLPHHTSAIVIDQAQALLTVQGRSELNFVALPYHWDSQHSGQEGEGSFEVAFELPGEPSEP